MHGEQWSAARRIRQIRQEHGLTQEQFAERVQKDRTTISNWETGKSEPSVEDWMTIRDAFGYQTVSDAMGERRAAKQEPAGWADYRRVIAALRRSRVLPDEHYRWLMAQARALEAELASPK